MMTKVAVMVAGALFAGVLSFVGAGGCEQTQNAFNCSDLCNRYRDCFNQAYDVTSCEDRCRNVADSSSVNHDMANSCQNCLNGSSCAATAALSCPSCGSYVP